MVISVSRDSRQGIIKSCVRGAFDSKSLRGSSGPGCPEKAGLATMPANSLYSGQPVHTDRATGGVAPELDELLDGEDSGEVFDAPAILGMTSLELRVGHRVARHPAYVSDADDVAVEVASRTPLQHGVGG